MAQAQVKDILNAWGRRRGPNPQRTDLWQVDLTAVITGLNKVAQQNVNLAVLPFIARYFTASISLPELKVRAEVIRRDSRSYNMPSWDEPLDAVRMTFIVDDGSSSTNANWSQSTIYTILDTWRAVVRAGRGEMTVETAILLDATYRINYAFPVYVYFLRGQMPPTLSTQPGSVAPAQSHSYGQIFNSAASRPVTVNQTISSSFTSAMNAQTGLDIGATLRLDNAWLSGFKVGELSYNQATVLTLEATLYADNIWQVGNKGTVTSAISQIS